MVNQSVLKLAAEEIAQANLLVVLSGAGISKESGVPTFRDAQDGLWSRYDPQELATPAAFRRNPDLVWSWYMYRANLVSSAAPNPGHFALAELETVIPKIVILTQNVDGLHEQARSNDIIELHGRLGRWKCFANCRGTPTVIDLAQIEYDAEHAPKCPYCTDRLRPDVVWFGEQLPTNALDRALEVAQQCDVMLVVGTSGVVEPAASLPQIARSAEAKVIEVNPEPSMITADANFFLQGKSGEILPALVEAVRAQA